MEKNQEPTWIWYPGEFEVWLHEKVSMRREERGRIYPPFWRVDTCLRSIKFRKKFEILKEEKVTLYAEGEYCATLDRDINIIYSEVVDYSIPAGQHELVVHVYNEMGLPCIYLKGETLVSDDTWEASADNKNWVPVGCWNFCNHEVSPSKYKLKTKEINAKIVHKSERSMLWDFGKETFGYLKLHHISGQGMINIYYGESQEEALSINCCETFDKLMIDGNKSQEQTIPKSRAFRFVNIVLDKNISIEFASALYEYLPVAYKGKFRCSDEMVNRIWDTSIYTLHLTTREFFLDGIKRDRWVWSGDVCQSALMNYYSFFDEDVTKRTYIALRGKDPVQAHINHIVDYSFYWFIGMFDYYLYTGDQAFIEQNYDKMIGQMQFCLRLKNGNGMIEGRPLDWVYVDWADIDNRGEVSIEQILFTQSLYIMSEFAQLMGDKDRGAFYKSESETLRKKTMEVFWSEEHKALLHNRYQGELQSKITKYPNIFALMFGFLNQRQIENIKNNVLLNDDVQKITTPYMRFYELGALCEIGQHDHVLSEIVDYWGGMLDLGATSFWEKYDPAQSGVEHYAMYDRPFGKSLCHAWGASPIYLLGKYYLGVRPLTPGYEAYLVQPVLGGLEWLEGTVPIPGGEINVYMDPFTIKIKSSKPGGYLRFNSMILPNTSQGSIKHLGDSKYELFIDQPQYEYIIKMKAGLM